MKRLDFIILILLLVSGHAHAQSQFRYKSGIGPVREEGWYQLSLTPEMFRHLNRDLSDLRIYSVKGRDTVELPYVLHVREEKLTSETVELPLFNKSSRDGALFLTFELKESQKVNYIDLEFEEGNFFGRVALEGSDDRLRWYEIANDRRIVSIQNDRSDYTLSAINFPLTAYRYLRARILADTPLTFRKASFQYHTTTPGVYRELPLTWKMRSDKKTQLSFIEIRFDDYVPVTSIAVQSDSSADYYRRFRLEYVRDSARTEKGWVKYYGLLDEGFLTSFKPNKFSFPHVTAQELRLVVSDHDNPPLAIRNVSASGPEVQVISYLKPGDNFILFGSDGLRSPTYDLAYFENKIPENPRVAVLNPAEKILSEESGTPPFFKSRLWLWSLMALLIAGLGYFTIRMIQQK